MLMHALGYSDQLSACSLNFKGHNFSALLQDDVASLPLVLVGHNKLEWKRYLAP
jgi:hypothetical protein